MKQKFLILAVLVLLVSNVFCIAGWEKSLDHIDAYHEYYKATENFLDELDHHYNWVDAFDPEAYYEAVDQLKNM